MSMKSFWLDGDVIVVPAHDFIGAEDDVNPSLFLVSASSLAMTLLSGISIGNEFLIRPKQAFLI